MGTSGLVSPGPGIRVNTSIRPIRVTKTRCGLKATRRAPAGLPGAKSGCPRPARKHARVSGSAVRTQASTARRPRPRSNRMRAGPPGERPPHPAEFRHDRPPRHRAGPLRQAQGDGVVPARGESGLVGEGPQVRDGGEGDRPPPGGQTQASAVEGDPVLAGVADEFRDGAEAPQTPGGLRIGQHSGEERRDGFGAAGLAYDLGHRASALRTTPAPLVPDAGVPAKPGAPVASFGRGPEAGGGGDLRVQIPASGFRQHHRGDGPHEAERGEVIGGGEAVAGGRDEPIDDEVGAAAEDRDRQGVDQGEAGAADGPGQRFPESRR